MKNLFNMTASLADKAASLISRAEHDHPGMQEVAAMVYVGDVYVLREQTGPVKNDGWGDHCYSCEAPDHL